jgi:hypothetical protein
MVEVKRLSQDTIDKVLVIDENRWQNRKLTMRAPDLGYAPRFLSIFLARSWFRQSGVISSHPKPVTPTVSWLFW